MKIKLQYALERGGKILTPRLVEFEGTEKQLSNLLKKYNIYGVRKRRLKRTKNN